MHLSAVTQHLFIGVILMLLTACSGDDSGNEPLTCPSGTTQACSCTNGNSGAQTCQDGAWLGCVCDGSPLCQSGASQACVCTDGASGSQTCGNNTWDSCTCDAQQPKVKKHGDICKAPDYDCGDNLGCIVEQQGDIQGICRVSCQGVFSCGENDDANDAGDTECCDVGGGTSSCFPTFTCT